MLARTGLPLQQSQCTTSLPLKAAPTALPLTRTLVVAKSTQPSRSSSPRSQAWWSSWRQELEHGSQGNGNGAHVDEYQEAPHLSNGNGYHHNGAEADGSMWRSNRWAGESQPEADDAEEGAYWSSSTDAPASNEYDTAAAAEDAEEEEGDSGGGFFTDAFKAALQDALKRSPLYADEYSGMGSADEETVEPQPYENEVEVYNRPIFNDQFRQVLKDSLARQQAELDTHGGMVSDDEYTPVPYVPMPPPRREMSPIEEIIATALGASQLHLRRLNLVKNEIELAIERETKQIERLDFALEKTRSDMAYYQTLERMMKEQERNRQ